MATSTTKRIRLAMLVELRSRVSSLLVSSPIRYEPDPHRGAKEATAIVNGLIAQLDNQIDQMRRFPGNDKPQERDVPRGPRRR